MHQYPLTLPSFQPNLVGLPDNKTACARCHLPTEWGEFEMRVLNENNQEAIALSMGNFAEGEAVLMRVHSECLTGDIFSSKRCDCQAQLHAAMAAIAKEGRGVLIYLRQEGRGIGLYNKILAYQLQEQGADTVEANRLLGLPDDSRTYESAARLLQILGVSSVRLMTNNPKKIKALEALGVTVKERIPLQVGKNPHNKAYMETKQRRMGHICD